MKDPASVVANFGIDFSSAKGKMNSRQACVRPLHALSTAQKKTAASREAINKPHPQLILADL